MKNIIKIYCAAILISLCLFSCEQKTDGFQTTENITYTQTTAHNAAESAGISQDDIAVYPEDDSDGLSLTFYPVGKGDCIIARFGEETMMIDSGYKKNRKAILEYLDENGIERLDIIIATHPDKDHIGAFAAIIESGIDIGIIYKTDAVKEDAKPYENFISAIEQYEIKTENPVLGSQIQFGDATVTFIGPVLKNYNDINDSSIVIRLEYAGKSFLLTGDMLTASESVLLYGEYAQYLPSDVLKVGHHGNNDASSYGFLAKVSPKYAVITSDWQKGDPPEKSVLDSLERVGANILRTDMDGMIKFYVSEEGEMAIFTDGSYIAVKGNEEDEDED